MSPHFSANASDGIRSPPNRGNASPLHKLKYNNAIAEAVADLGQSEQIQDTFLDFQKYLDQGAVCVL